MNTLAGPPSTKATPNAANPTPPHNESEVLRGLQQTVSASRLTLFLQCRLRFYFRHVVAIPKPKTPALHVGSTVHAVLKAWHKARWLHQPLSLKETHEAFERLWDHPEDEEPREPVDWQGEEAEAKLTAWRLCETYLRQCGIAPGNKPDAVEVPVEADLAKHGLPKLIGILDLVQDKRIIDYKTASSTPNSEKVGHLHEVQITTYGVLYREATGQRENGIELHHLVKLKSPKLVITALPPMRPEQQTKLFHLMEAYGKGLDRKDFVPSPGPSCMSCEFFQECRRWK
jgi:CRISPR/Cas system-associated exonuclease Cas4 (RecB family)